MSHDAPQQRPAISTAGVDPAENIVQHLLRQPSDLIDTGRLMRRFHASVQDFQRALTRLEQLLPPEEGEATS